MFHKKTKLMLILAAWIFVQPAFAAPVEEAVGPVMIRREVTLEGLLHEAMEKSPGLRAKKNEYESAQAKVMTAWLPEDPKVGIDVEGQPDLFHTGRRTDNEYSVNQSIPFPTKLFLRGVIASKEADMAYQRYQQEQRELIWHMEQPYYELFLGKKTLEALEDNQKILEQLVKSARARYESNQANQQDLLKAQIELSKNAVEQFDWREKIHVQQAHFAHLLNQSLETEYLMPEKSQRTPFTYTKKELEDLALKKRPELKEFEIAIERSKVNRTLTDSDWLPDIELRVEARQFRGDNEIKEVDNFVGISVPVFSLLKGIGGIWKSAGLEVNAAEAMYEKLKNETFLSIHTAYSKVKASDNALTSYENSILPQAKQAVELALAAYEAGQSDFLNVVDAERTLRQIQIEYFGRVAEYEMGLSDLRLAVGDDLLKAG